MVKPMTKEEIIRLFRDNIGIKQLMNENQYHISTREIDFEYDGEPKSVKNISFLSFTDNGKVWFNDEGFELDKIPEAPFMFSTEPSETTHPLVSAFFKASKVIELFGGEI